MNDITMPLAIILIFLPPCLGYYAPGILSIAYLLQKGMFILCAAYFLRYRIFEQKYFLLLMGYVLWAIFVTYYNGNSIGTVGNYLNLFSLGVVTVFCMESKPVKFTGCVATWFTFLLFLNTVLWRDGGMYLNSNNQMSFVLGTKTSLTEYQLVACSFIWLYHQMLPKEKKWKAIFLWIISALSLIFWNLRQPITTSILCFVSFTVLIYLRRSENKILEVVLRVGFWVIILFNLGIVFFNIQMLFENFITNVLHENADLNFRTSIWQLVLARIADSPWIGHGLRSNTYFAVGTGVASINQATHNGLLYFLFTTGIIGTAYVFMMYLLASFETGVKSILGKVFHITMICFAIFWVSEQLNGYGPFFLCLLGGVSLSKRMKNQACDSVGMK